MAGASLIFEEASGEAVADIACIYIQRNITIVLVSHEFSKLLKQKCVHHIPRYFLTYSSDMLAVQA